MNKEAILIFFVVSVAFISVFLYLEPSITGYAIYNVNNYTWDFSNLNDYNYENVTVNNLVVLDNYTEQINVTNILTSSLISAMHNNNDVLDKLISLDLLHLTFNKDNLDLEFNQSLDNDYIINLYLENYSKNTNIYVCNYNEDCSFPGYGALNFNGNEGWYYIILENLTENKSQLRLISENHTKINYIVSNYTEILPENNIEYYLQGSIESNDIILDEDNILLKYDSTGSIDFYYSSNSGLNWNEFTDNQTINLTNNTLRFKAILNKNEVMPELRNVDVYIKESFPETNSTSPQSEQNPGGSSGGGGGGSKKSSKGNNEKAIPEISKKISTNVLEPTLEEEKTPEVIYLENSENEEIPLEETNFESITGRSVKDIINDNSIYMISIVLLVLILISIFLKYYTKREQ